MDMFSGPQLARDEVTGLGSAMAGGKGKLAKTRRRALDFYPTPPECTRALLIAERRAIVAHGATVWECCGRGGAVARVLAEFMLGSIATDLVADPDNDCAGADVLAVREALAAIVVTNPPFAIAARIIAHLLGQLGIAYLALLLKTSFWSTDTEGRGRIGLWRHFPPSRRWDLTWRPDFLEGEGRRKGRGSTMNVSWFIWDSKAPANDLPPGMVPFGLLSRTGPVAGPRPDLFSQGAEA
ncbi:MAG TPA: hypothetical protein VGW34_03265 [Allosphingosinicella sp.]|nr:hypothetical protein [Allosphingosinicella sp.]